MGVDPTTVDKVAALLARLDELCDTGYALAIHIRYTRPSLLYRTYSQEWIDTYSTKGYMLFDPVVRWGLMNTGGVDWSDLKSEDPEGVMTDAAAHGLLFGWTHSTGPATSRTISGLTRSTGPFTEAEKAELSALLDDLHAATEGIEQFDEAMMEALRALG